MAERNNMGKYITGTFTCKISFHDLYVEDGQDEIDALFPDGWEGEMDSERLTITDEYEDEA